MKPGTSIFFSGIGGSGMSALACYTQDRGMRVSGSDRSFDQNPDHPVAKLLGGRGIEIVPQDGSHPVPGDSLMVMSAAVEEDRPEVVRARELGVPALERAQYLASITEEHRTIAVAGTSGKSTTAGMLAYSMETLGLDPVFIGGGRAKQFKSTDNPGNYRNGNSGPLVVEACESDGYLSSYRAEHSIILNIGLDHLGIEKTLGLFQALAHNTEGNVILNADEPGLAPVRSSKALTFSCRSQADMMAEDIRLSPMGSAFRFRGAEVRLRMPGLHNVINALATLSVLELYGVSPGDAAEALYSFEGIERRFDVHLDELGSGGALVVDDYAHNPHKISFLMETMRRISKRVCYVFQPHGFGPLRMMFEELKEVFSRLLRPEDSLVVLPVFYAGGTADKSIGSPDLAGAVTGRAWAPGGRAEALSMLDTSHEAFVVFGARDESLSGLASDIALRLRRGGPRKP